MKLLTDSLETYFESASLILVFGFLVLAVMLFLLGFFTYVSLGGGFIRYADVLTGAIEPLQGLVFLIVTLVSIFSLSFLSTAVTLIVKLRRSMDDTGFMKLLTHFPRFVSRLMIAWSVLGLISFVIGLVFTAVSLPSWVTALALLSLWGFFIFLPQSLILQDKTFFHALRDSVKYSIRKPKAILFYYALTSLFFLLMLFIDVGLGQTKIFWLPAFINTSFLFLFVLPFIEIVKVNLYITRYRLLLSGLR